MPLNNHFSQPNTSPGFVSPHTAYGTGDIQGCTLQPKKTIGRAAYTYLITNIISYNVCDPVCVLLPGGYTDNKWFTQKTSHLHVNISSTNQCHNWKTAVKVYGPSGVKYCSTLSGSSLDELTNHKTS